MISESPTHSISFSPISIAFLSPWTNASYSATLLVHSNYNMHVIIVLIPLGSIRTHLAPAPSLDLEPYVSTGIEPKVVEGSLPGNNRTTFEERTGLLLL